MPAARKSSNIGNCWYICRWSWNNSTGFRCFYFGVYVQYDIVEIAITIYHGEVLVECIQYDHPW